MKFNTFLQQWIATADVEFGFYACTYFNPVHYFDLLWQVSASIMNIQGCNNFFIFPSRSSVYTSPLINTIMLCFYKTVYSGNLDFYQHTRKLVSKYSIRVVFLKLKIFLVLQYRHIIHLFEDEAL